MPAQRTIIRPDYDPVVVTLDTPPEGIQREGQRGVDYQYILNNNKGIMWAPKSLRDAILQSGARKGDEVEICKSQRGGYIATRLSDAAEPSPVPARSQRQAPPAPVAMITPAAQPLASQQLAAQPHQVAAVNVITEQLSFCLRSAIDAMCNARAYAASKSLALDGPSWEDVRAIALSVYIGKTRNGGAQ